MTKLTQPQKRALRILRDHGPLRPREFAGLMWPDSPGWNRLHNCGPYGAAYGTMMPMCGGGYLAKLKYRGWVEESWRRSWDGQIRSKGYILTPKGRELAKEPQDAQVK